MGYGSFVVFILVMFLSPPDNRWRIRVVEIKALSNGKQIGTACRIYASEHQGAYPATLEELVPDYYPGGEAFICPFTPTEPMGYIYYPGQHDTDPAENVLLVSKGVSEFGRRVVIHMDGSGYVMPYALPESAH